MLERRIGGSDHQVTLASWSDTGVGSPQGAAPAWRTFTWTTCDWFQNHWRKRMTDTIIVRYADDLVCGFQYQGDAKRWDLGERLAHLNCTRTIIEFGRFAGASRRKRGQDVRLPRHDALLRANEEGQVQGRPQTIPETGTLRRIKEALRKLWHDNRHKTAKWRVIKGWLNYYAVPGIRRAVSV